MTRSKVYLAYFPFGGTVGRKLRPVLALSDPVGPVPEVLVAYISAQMPTPVLPTDLILDPSDADHASTNLRRRSVLRLHKLATVHRSDIKRRLGQVSTTVIAEIDAKLRAFLGL